MAEESKSLLGGSNAAQDNVSSPTWLKVLSGFVVGAGCYAAYDHFVRGEPATEMVAPMSMDPFSEALACGSEGSLEWAPVSGLDDGVQKALSKALKLLDSTREDCPLGPLPDLPFAAAEFEQPHEKGSSTKLVAHHKFSPDCQMETFKLHLQTGVQPEQTSIVVEMFHTIEDDRWEVLKSSPSPCQIKIGTAAAPEMQPADSKIVKDAANFAISELGFDMRNKGCLANTSTLQIKEILSATTSVIDGIETKMLMSVQEKSASGHLTTPATIELIVTQICGIVEGGGCVNALAVPKSETPDVCKLLLESDEASALSRSRRLLKEVHRVGPIIQPDATDMKLRRLAAYNMDLSKSSSKVGPGDYAVRYIPSHKISVPANYDPRTEDKDQCEKNIPVLAQGNCGSCYAMATAAMVGVRACKFDRQSRHRRLLESVQDVPDLIEGRKEAPERALKADCVDNPSWQNFLGLGCDWYASNPTKCKLFDWGQLTHCQKSCGDCYEEPTTPSPGLGKSSAGVDFSKYMPDPSQLAVCERGCNGGHILNIWSHNFQKRDKDLHSLGKTCDAGVLSCGDADVYYLGFACYPMKNWKTWEKPCSCIPAEQRSVVCKTEAPPKQCSTTTPYGIARVKTVNDGLSLADGVGNIQRHLYEYGPLWVILQVTEGLMSLSSDPDHIWSDTSSPDAGPHAVMMSGWGTSKGTDYWSLRNSWGTSWADEGYFKMLRGINMRNVESEVWATMPTPDYEELSDGRCEFVKGSKTFSLLGDMLESYTWTGHVKCNKPCTVSAWYANGHHGFYGAGKKEVTSTSDIWSFDVPLHCLNYGLGQERDIEIRLDIQDDDRTGSERITIVVPPIPGANEVSFEFCSQF